MSPVLKFGIKFLWVSVVCTFWGWMPLEGHSTHSPAYLLVSCAKAGTMILLWGDGYIFCKPFGDWSKQRFEVTTHTLIGFLDSHEGSQAKDFRKGLLFLCFREPNCLLSTQFYNQITRRKMVCALQLMLNALQGISIYLCCN